MSRDLQREAVAKFGMDVQLLHAVEELTELSMEVQRLLRRRRAGVWSDNEPLLEEYCDAVAALATVRLYLMDHFNESVLADCQRRKAVKFAAIIDAGA